MVNLQLISVFDRPSAASVNLKLIYFRRSKLSKREEQCLIWAARGKTYQDISDILNISFGSVKSYLDTARHKLKLHQFNLMRFAVAIRDGGNPTEGPALISGTCQLGSLEELLPCRTWLTWPSRKKGRFGDVESYRGNAGVVVSDGNGRDVSATGPAVFFSETTGLGSRSKGWGVRPRCFSTMKNPVYLVSVDPCTGKILGITTLAADNRSEHVCGDVFPFLLRKDEFIEKRHHLGDPPAFAPLPRTGSLNAARVASIWRSESCLPALAKWRSLPA